MRVKELSYRFSAAERAVQSGTEAQRLSQTDVVRSANSVFMFTVAYSATSPRRR
jgi:hypothetical protein